MEMNVRLPKIQKIVLMFIMNLQRLQQNPSLEINLIDNVGLYYPHDNIVCSHLCDECKKSNELSVTVRASLFTDQRMSGPPIRAMYKQFKTI